MSAVIWALCSALTTLILNAEIAHAQIDTLSMQQRLAFNFVLATVNDEEVWTRLRASNSFVDTSEPPFQLLREADLFSRQVDSLVVFKAKVRVFEIDIPRMDAGSKLIAVTDRFELFPLWGFETNWREQFVIRLNDWPGDSFGAIARLLVRLDNLYAGRDTRIIDAGGFCDSLGGPLTVANGLLRQSITLWSAPRGMSQPKFAHSVEVDVHGFTMSTIQVSGGLP